MVCTGSTCCDTCCSTCCSTQPGVGDSGQHGSKSLQGSQGQTVSNHTPASSTPSSPFKIFRTSERRSDTDDSLEDSSNTLPHTPPYAGVDVEPVEKPLTEEDEDTAATVVQLSHRLDMEVDASIKKTPLNTGNGIIAGNHEEALLLMPVASNTVDTLFGEVSDSNSGEPVVDISAANENNVVLSITKDHPSTPAKVSSTDIEDGEITDSDTEQSVTVLPSNVTSVADKENDVVSVKSRVQANAQRSDHNKQNTNCAKQSSQSHHKKTSSRTPPRNQISREQERSPSSRKKNNSGSDTHRGDRRRSPQRKHTPDGRRDRRAIHETAGHSSEQRIGSGTRRTERRQSSPRKNAERSRPNFAKLPFRGRRNSSGRFVRTPRRF